MQQAGALHHSRFSYWKPYLFLLFITLIAYWPISLQLFSVKNDAIHYFLPVRYQISNSIQHGFFPFWSNSFYLGYPLHGDMQTGAWNPFVQFISFFTTYNVTVFHSETLFYIFLGGVGMYKMAGIISASVSNRLVIATAYMLSGYMLGSGEFINWLASAAFIPFVLVYYYRFLHEPSIGYALKTAISIWLLLVCGYPADTIIIAYIMIGMSSYFFARNRKTIGFDKKMVMKYIRLHGLLALVALLLLSPALLSWFDLLPYYSRGTGAGLAEAMINSFDPRSSLSFVAPWGALASDFPAPGDITGRNIFIGIYTLVFAFAAFILPNNRHKTILLLAAITSFLFCLGDATPFRAICYNILPGMDTFRHPSHFRLYTIISLLLLAAFTLDQLSQKNSSAEKKTRLMMIGGIGVLVLLMAFSFIQGAGRLPSLSSLTSREGLRSFLENITWQDMLLFSCIIQLFFLAIFLFITKKKKTLPAKAFLLLHILNLVINSIVALPATFVSKSSPAVLNKLIRDNAGYTDTAAFNRTLKENSKDAFDHSTEIGLKFFYTQKPALTKVTNSPAFLSSMDEFVQTDRLYNYILEKSVAWLSNRPYLLADTILLNDSNNKNCPITIMSETRVLKVAHPCDSLAGTAIITKALPGRFTVKVNSNNACQLNISQAYHHGWRAYIKGNEVPVYQSNISFMRVNVPGGESNIEWKFDAGAIPFWFIVSLITLGGIVVFLVIAFIKRRRNY